MANTIICPNCKTINPGENVFCQSCGTKLDAAAPAFAASTPPPPPTVQAVGAVPPPAPTPPAYMPPPPPQAYMPVATPISKMGIKVDEYNDIVPESAEDAAFAKETFVDLLAEIALPGVTVSEGLYKTGSRQRPYTTIKHPAATILADISPVGKDLQGSWMLYVKRTLNWLPLAILGGVALLLPLAWSFWNPAKLMGMMGELFGAGNFFKPQFLFPLYVFGFLGIIILGVLGFMLVGKVIKDNPWWLFVKDVNDIDWQDINLFQTEVHEAMIYALEELDLEEEILEVTKVTQEKKPAMKAPAKSASKPAAKKK